MTQILMIIRMQFAAGVESDLVQHSCEIPQTADGFTRAFWEDIHLGKYAINQTVAVSANSIVPLNFGGSSPIPKLSA